MIAVFHFRARRPLTLEYRLQPAERTLHALVLELRGRSLKAGLQLSDLVSRHRLT